MTKRFREAFLAEVERRGVSLRKVSKGTGVSYEQLKKLKQRPDATTNVEDAVLLARFFGLGVDDLLENEAVSDRAQIVEIYSQLSMRERAILRSAAKDLEAPDVKAAF